MLHERPPFSTCPPPATDIHQHNGPPALSKKERAEDQQWLEKRLADWRATRPSLDDRIERIGVPETLRLATARFAVIAEDYFSLWSATEAGADQFADQLEGIRRLVFREVEDLWEPQKSWFDQYCRPAIESGMAPMIAAWKRRSRRFEIERLENPPTREQMACTSLGPDSSASTALEERVAVAGTRPVISKGAPQIGSIARRGPKPISEADALYVANVVDRIGNGWRGKLEEVGFALDHGICDAPNPETCEAPEHEKIALPRGWAKQRRCWMNPPSTGVLIKAIEERLERARKLKRVEIPS